MSRLPSSADRFYRASNVSSLPAAPGEQKLDPEGAGADRAGSKGKRFPNSAHKSRVARIHAPFTPKLDLSRKNLTFHAPFTHLSRITRFTTACSKVQFSTPNHNDAEAHPDFPLQACPCSCAPCSKSVTSFNHNIDSWGKRKSCVNFMKRARLGSKRMLRSRDKRFFSMEAGPWKSNQAGT